MATPTYDLLESVTLTATASSVTFSSIDQSYGDLILTVAGVGVGGTNYFRCRLNGDTGTNYYLVNMFGEGSDFTSISGSDDNIPYGNLSTTGGSFTAQLFDYTATDKHKSLLVRSGSGDVRLGAFACRWASTSAVTSIELYSSGTGAAAASTFNLYGVAK